MSQRSPMNPRYQKGTGPKGQTRRSAASAKPKRDLAESTGASRPKSGSSKSKPSVKERYAATVPANPLYKTYRRVWWGALGVALLSLVVSLAMSFEPLLSWGGETGATVAASLSYGALGLIAYSWYIDLRKIRPIMKEWAAMSPKEREAARVAAEPTVTDATESEQ